MRPSSALFSIRIYVNPLLERLEADPSLRPRIANLVRSAIPEVSEYKGYASYAAELLAWLDAEPSAEPAQKVRARYHKVNG